VFRVSCILLLTEQEQRMLTPQNLNGNGPQSGLPTPEHAVRTSQIILGMFILGMTMMGVVFLVIGQKRSSPPATIAGQSIPFEQLLVGIGSLVLIGGFAFGLAFKATQLRRIRRDADQGVDVGAARIFQAYITTNIIRGALLEGPGLLGAVTTFLTGSPLGVGLTALAVILLTIIFPTRSSFESFARDATGRIM
jgi:hypothetical protein